MFQFSLFLYKNSGEPLENCFFNFLSDKFFYLTNIATRHLPTFKLLKFTIFLCLPLDVFITLTSSPVRRHRLQWICFSFFSAFHRNPFINVSLLFPFFILPYYFYSWNWVSKRVVIIRQKKLNPFETSKKHSKLLETKAW